MVCNPAHYAIVKFNGVRQMSRAIGVDQAFVHRWGKRGMIPAQHQIKVLEKAIELGIKLTPKNIIFGGEIPDSKIKSGFRWLLNKK